MTCNTFSHSHLFKLCGALRAHRHTALSAFFSSETQYLPKVPESRDAEAESSTLPAHPADCYDGWGGQQDGHNAHQARPAGTDRGLCVNSALTGNDRKNQVAHGGSCCRRCAGACERHSQSLFGDIRALLRAESDMKLASISPVFIKVGSGEHKGSLWTVEGVLSRIRGTILRYKQQCTIY